MFSDRLKNARKKKKLYQKELAAILGVSRSAVTAWETGARFPEFETLKRMADVLEVSVDYLLGRTDDPSPKNPDRQAEKDPLFKLLEENPDSITVEQALEFLLKSSHVMFDGKPVGELNNDILQDIRDTVIALLKYKASLKKAAASVKGVVNLCPAALLGAG